MTRTTPEPDLGQFECMDPCHVRLFMHKGMLCLETEDAVHLKVKVARAFPLSLPHRYIGFLTRDGHDIGVVKDSGQLDDNTRSLLQEALEKRYFAPKVKRIRAIFREHGNLRWKVDTDLGEREFAVHDFRENLLNLTGSNMYVTDVDGNRYDIGRLSDLDPSSRAVLERWI